MIDQSTYKKDLKRALQLSSKFERADGLIVNFPLDINTTSTEEINDITQAFILNLTELTKRTPLYFIITYVELDGTNKDDITLNYKLVLTCPKFKFSKYQLNDLITEIVGDEVWIDLKYGNFSREEILVEIIPIHFGISDIDVIKRLPKSIYDLIINDPINVISNEFSWKNKQL
jgi:hypothetical protein